ncbi:hypothetical protein BD413DRAFT_485951 [Trametes elegans]|nr:hypothetical protein BD413DRAFT_485951 [Trametes elegans]
MPLSLAGLEAHPGRYLGPQFVSLTLEAIQTGILINQSLTFWERAERELNVVRTLVSFVTIVAFLQTSLRFYTSWRTFVERFGDWISSVLFIWADKIQSTTTVLMATPVQAFLIWRCWTLFNRNLPVLVLLVTLLLAQLVASVVVTVQTFHVTFGVVPEAEVEAGPLPKVPVCHISFSIVGAILDILVTGILLTFLARSKQNVMSSRFRRILRRLTVLIWEAALPPCVCAVMTVLIYISLVDVDYWDLTFQAILGKLYVISLFVTLNGRAELQDGPAPGFSTNRLSNLIWSLNTPIRVDVGNCQSLPPNEINWLMSTACVQIPTDLENRGVSTRNTQDDSSANTPVDPSRTPVNAEKTS